MSIQSENTSLKDLQDYVSQQHRPKKKHRQKYFLKLVEEVGELSAMIKEDKRHESENGEVEAIKNTVEEEMADVLYYLLALANTYEIDLQKTFVHKQQYKSKYSTPKSL